MKRAVCFGLAILLIEVVAVGFIVALSENQICFKKCAVSEEIPAEAVPQNVSETWQPSPLLRERPECSLDSKLVPTSCQDEDSEEIIVGLRDSREAYEKAKVLLSENKAEVINTITGRGQPLALVADVPHGAARPLRQQLLNDSLVSYVEPNMRFRTAAVPNDPEWRTNWGLGRIMADYAWNITVGEPAVVVAIVDTGVDWIHADLAGNIWNNTDEKLDGTDSDGNGFDDDVRGWDFVDTSADVWPGEDGTWEDNDPMDFYGHGTHCAGIAAAVGNNGIGISGVTWNCRIMPVRCGYKDAEGQGVLENDAAAAGVIYAADNGARIISCSWGEYSESYTIHEAIRYAHNAGALVVAAAGNEFTDLKAFPAAYSEVVGVSATTSADEAAYFSNYGDWIELAAPGLDIYSTVPGDSYALMSGTSMSAPFAAGVAALIWSRFPSMNRDQVREQLRFTSKDLGAAGFDVHFGFGRVDAKKAVELDQEDHDLAVFDIGVASPFLLSKPARVNVSLINMGRLPESNLAVQLLANDTLVKTGNVPSLGLGELKHVSLLCDASQFAEGHCNLTARVVPVSGENRVENNRLFRIVLARQPHTIRVPQDYVTTQKAIDEALEGDTIAVAAGSYGAAYVYKDSLKLIGNGSGTCSIIGGIDGIRVCANNVEISGFTLIESRRRGVRMPPFSGLLLYYCNNVNVTDIQASNNEAGIFLYCSSNVKLRNCRMMNNIYDFGMEGEELSNFLHDIDASNTARGQPVHYLKNERSKAVSDLVGSVALVNCTDMRLENLTLMRNYAGVSCVFCHNVTIRESEAELNGIGVYLRSCTSVKVWGLNITENDTGMRVENSENITADDNFIGGPYTSHYGLVIRSSQRCQARFNTLRDNRVNLYLDHSSRNIVASNEISKAEQCGLSLADSTNNTISGNAIISNIPIGVGQCVGLNLTKSSGNLIYHNCFVNNTRDALIRQSITAFDDDYPSGGSFWSNYTGVDFHRGPFQNETGTDGIGDTPHIIDAYNIDRYPLIRPPLTLETEQRVLNATKWEEWLNCTIESPLLISYQVNASIVFAGEALHIKPENLALGDHNNNGVPDLVLLFNRYEIVDFAMQAMTDNSSSFKIFRGFALRLVLVISGKMEGIAFEIKNTITVTSSVSAIPI